MKWAYNGRSVIPEYKNHSTVTGADGIFWPPRGPFTKQKLPCIVEFFMNLKIKTEKFSHKKEISVTVAVGSIPNHRK